MSYLTSTDDNKINLSPLDDANVHVDEMCGKYLIWTKVTPIEP